MESISLLMLLPSFRRLAPVMMARDLTFALTNVGAKVYIASLEGPCTPENLLPDFLASSAGCEYFLGSKWSPRRSEWLGALVRAWRPRVIHSHCFRPDLLASTQHLVRVTTVHNVMIEDYSHTYSKIVARLMVARHCRALQEFSQVIAVSRASQQYLLSRGIRKAEVIYNSVDTRAFCPPTVAMRDAARAELGLGRDDFVVLVLGRLDSVKNSAFLCQFALHNYRHVGKMIFVGDGPDLRKFREASAATEGGVQFVGFQPEREIFMHAANVLLSGSRSEGMPLSVLEAIASGLPCVLSDIPAHREIKQWVERLDGSAATRIKIVPGNEVEYLTALAAIKKDPPARETPPAVERELSAARMAQQYWSAYVRGHYDGGA